MQSSSSGSAPYNTKVLTSATDVPSLLLQGFLKEVLVVVVLSVVVVVGVVLIVVLLEVVVSVVVVVGAAVVELISLPLRLGPQQTFNVILVHYIK